MSESSESGQGGGPPAVSRETIAKLARLARLVTSPAEDERLAGEMGNILAYMASINALDIEQVPRTAHAVDLPTKLRDDVVRPSLPIEKVMQNAPERLGDGFGVPKIIE